jgi:uncharacterized protein
MFRLYITLAFILPNIYVFFRIKDLFISKGYKLWFLLVYLLIVAIYPLLGSFPGRDMNLISRLLSFLSDYILPFYLYLFLSVLFFDLFLLLNLLIKILPYEVRKSLWFRIYALTAIIIISVLVVVSGVINLNTIRVSKYQVTVPKKSSSIDHLKVAFVADFHIQQDIPLDFVEQFVRKVNDLQPDIMLYGGDIVEGSRANGTLETIESNLRTIHTKLGSYGVLGNHESYGRRETGSFFRKAGITLLRDSLVKIDSSFYLAGRYDQQYRGRKSVNEIIGTESSDLPVILLDHRPTELQETSLTPVDVQFSGHTHDGQMFPINLILHTMYELTWGYKKIRNTHFFVTSGIRLWGPPVKTAGKSEIMLVDIHFE